MVLRAPRWIDRPPKPCSGWVKRPNEILRKASAYWPDLDPVEIATLEWVDWFNNRRLLGPIGSVSPSRVRAAL
jgi:transposase InsO family protein